ncbi:MAG TPA: NAD(P)-dependent oxidoreductase [Microthrixaceae bacterium]|nr:NAD(P)-dependent oxidoreductase [Microthrixaceae bacterium]
MSDGRRVVVLGRGFVGRAVDRRLRADPGHEVVVLEPADDAELAGRTPAGAERLRAAIGSSSKPVVINCCGRLRGTDEELLDANARWPQWLTEVLDGAAVRLVHLGSASEYGDPGGPTPLTEDTPARPTGSYGETKWAGTSSVFAARSGGADASVVRGFNLVSEDLSPVSPLHQFRADVLALPPEGGSVTLWDPSTVRDFILLDDLAWVVVAVALHEDPPDVVNACSGVGVDFGSIVRALGDATGRVVTVESLDRPGIPVVLGDPTRMRAVTGVQANMDAALLARTVLGQDGGS